MLASPCGRGGRAQRGRREQTTTIQKDCKPLSVTCGDSSPKGRAETVEKYPLCSAPQLPADSGQFNTHAAQSIFSHAHVAAEIESYSFLTCRNAAASHPKRRRFYMSVSLFQTALDVRQVFLAAPRRDRRSCGRLYTALSALNIVWSGWNTARCSLRAYS